MTAQRPHPETHKCQMQIACYHPRQNVGAAAHGNELPVILFSEARHDRLAFCSSQSTLGARSHGSFTNSTCPAPCLLWTSTSASICNVRSATGTALTMRSNACPLLEVSDAKSSECQSSCESREQTPSPFRFAGVPKQYSDILCTPALEYMVDVYRRTLLVDRKFRLQSLLEHRKSGFVGATSCCSLITNTR